MTVRYIIHENVSQSKIILDYIYSIINIMMNKLEINKLWINPDCGLKTRGIEETKQSLINMVNATKTIRKYLEK